MSDELANIFRRAGRCSAGLIAFVLGSAALDVHAASPYGAGPGGPILIVTNSASPVSVFYAEILLTEGLNAFSFADISGINGAVLANYDVVLLGRTSLTTNQVNTLSNWVVNGGNLIAMQPDKKLTNLLGLIDAGGTLAEGYLKLNTNAVPGAGLVGETMQYHGVSDRYSLGGATSIATLYSNATNATPYHAVTWRSLGSNGGQAAAFSYDLATSVFLTRQGNPAWADQNRDGDGLVRSDDLFFGATANAAYGPPTNDWVNLTKIAIPQADEQQRLLARLIVELAADRKPLPRFWYFPRSLKAAIVMTGDDHGNVFGGNNGTKGRFDQYQALSPTNASVPDWEAVRGTSYVFPTNVSLTASQANAFEAAGFEIGIHCNSGCAAYTASSITGFLTNQINTFKAKYPAVPLPTTHRLHCIAWSGYTVLPEAQRAQGIRFDVNYYHFPAAWLGNVQGFMTGSGMPMRFCRTNGEPIDIYQAATQMTDESGQSYPATINQLLDRALGPEGYYGAFVANMHTDQPVSSGSDAIVSSALSRGVAVVSARQMLTWIDARNASKFQNISWSNSVLSFVVDAATEARGLRSLVPVLSGSSVSFVASNGVSIAWNSRQIKGTHYAEFPAYDATYQIGIVPDVVPPTVATTSPMHGEFGVDSAASVKVAFSEAVDPATVTTNNFLLTSVLGNAVAVTVTYDEAKQEVTLKPQTFLSAGMGYRVRILGGSVGVKDLAGIALAEDFEWVFATVPSAQWSVWPTVDVAPQLDSDTNEVELGVRIRTSASGHVTALRFYKMSGQPSTHVGNLWSSNGVNLATVTFTNETASGWQIQALPSPVAIASNATIVASYRAPAGGYAVTSQYFKGKGVTNGPLIAPQDGVGGNNGLYRYNPLGFPTNTFNSENYWVDVVFQPAAGTNSAPFFLAQPGNKIVPELIALTVTNAALDPDAATQSLTYQLLNPPANAVISTNGVISWVPSEAQGPSTNQILTVASDGAVTVTNSFQIIVTEVNAAPFFVLTPTNRVIPELTQLTVTNQAADNDLPAQNLTYTLLNPPAGALISSNGVITWTPSEAQGPGVFQLVTVASDGMASVTNAFEVQVTEVNLAPVAFSQSLTNAEDTALDITLSAADPDGPVTNFVLTVGPVHGVLSGVPPHLTYQPGTNYFGSDSFAFTVNDGSLTSAPAPVSLWVTNVNDAPVLPAPDNLYVGVFGAVTVTNTAYDVDNPGIELSYQLLPGSGASISTNGIIAWMPKSGPATNVITTVVFDGGVPILSATNSFSVVVTNAVVPPVIQAIEVSDDVATLFWSAMSNGVYRVLFLNDVAETNWMELSPDVTATGPVASATNTLGGQPVRFYRILVVP